MKELTLNVAESVLLSPRDEFWNTHYNTVYSQPNPWLDLSNERVQLQGFAAAIEASGGVLEKACLDAGCGRGQLSRALQAFGATTVTGFDINRQGVEELRASHPSCRWVQGNISDPSTYLGLGKFDLVFALEVLQYVALDKCLPLLWGATRPGGRLIGLVPNSKCPTVQKTMRRFSGQYAAISTDELKQVVSSLEGLEFWACKGLWFRDDQRIAPYDLSQWTSNPDWQMPPNRVLFLAQRAREVNP